MQILITDKYLMVVRNTLIISEKEVGRLGKIDTRTAYLLNANLLARVLAQTEKPNIADRSYG